MKALMLAAGMARRLYGEENDELPKSLIRFDGQSLLQRHIELLQAYGVDELVLIVGHRKEDLLAEAETVARDGFVRSFFNPRYKEGPLLSLATGDSVLRSGDDVMFMDADVLYHPILLEKLILSPHRNCFIVDRQFQSDDDPVKLCLRENKVVDFGKTVDVLYDTVGEWPGFLKMSPAIAVKVADSVQGFIDRGEEVGPYEDAFREVLLSEPADTFAHEDVTDIPWIEIDYPSDLKKATTNIFPRISDYLAEITVTEAEAKPADEDGSTASGA